MTSIVTIIFASYCFFTQAMTAPAAKEADWTIMVFLNGDNNLEPYALKDFDEMAQVDLPATVHLVAQFDRSPFYSDAYGDWTGTLRFLLRRGLEPTEQSAVANLGELNMGDGNVLADFVRWARMKYPARHYMLVIWDHGQGWRGRQAVQSVRMGVEQPLNREALRTSREQLIQRSRGPEEAGPTIAPDEVVPATVRYVSSDDTSNDHLFNREIQDSLRVALAGQALDIIGFDACLMGMVETAYAMRELAHTMIASEELEPGDGWNYELILKKLAADPSVSPAALAKLVVDAYEQHYGEGGIAPNPATTLSALDLTKIWSLAGRTSELADALTRGAPHEHGLIRAVRQTCRSYAPGYGLHSLDLGHFCDALAAETKDDQIRNLAQSVRAAVQDAVIENYAGLARVGSFGSMGVAIYFPADALGFENDPDAEGYRNSNAHYPVQFVQDYRWDEYLLQTYLPETR